MAEDIIDEINGCFAGEDGREDGIKLFLINTGNKINVKKKAKLIFENIGIFFNIVVLFVLSFFKLFYDNGRA